MSLELPNPQEPVLMKVGTITVTCNNVIAPNGQILQSLVNVECNGFPGDTAEGQIALFGWLSDAAKAMGVAAFNLQKQGGQQSQILRPQPGLKIQ